MVEIDKADVRNPGASESSRAVGADTSEANYNDKARLKCGEALGL